MKPMRWIGLLAGLLVLVFLAGCSPNKASDSVILGGGYRLASGDTLDHDLAVFGGSVILEENSVVNGSVAVFGGSLAVNGEVNGEVAAFGGAVSLGEKAVVHGDVVTFGASVSRSASAVVSGDIGSNRQPLRLPGSLPPLVNSGVQFVSDLIWRVFQSFALAALAVLVSLFALRPMERAGDAVIAQPAAAGGMGFLTVLVSPFVLVLVAITIVLAPVSVLGFLILAIAGLFGWLVLGLITGERLAHLFNQEWNGPVSAGVGTLVLSLVANMVGIIPCIGGALGALVGIIGLGGVVLTRFGTQVYPQRPQVVDQLVQPAPPGPQEG